jgi:hypothetical protein
MEIEKVGGMYQHQGVGEGGKAINCKRKAEEIWNK